MGAYRRLVVHDGGRTFLLEPVTEVLGMTRSGFERGAWKRALGGEVTTREVRRRIISRLAMKL